MQEIISGLFLNDMKRYYMWKNIIFEDCNQREESSNDKIVCEQKLKVSKISVFFLKMENQGD